MTQHDMSYSQAIDWIYGLINYERRVGRSRDFRLDRMRQLLATIGDPHRDIPAVHIAGTKGKGSTAAMISAILTHGGLVTGLFTSPHITRFEERIQVDGQEPSEEELAELVGELRSAIDKDKGPSPTYFEAAMLLGWCLYRRRAADAAVLEVGLGGRLDATNVCHPSVCVITSISLDHTQVLGDTLAKISAEKAGIIKPGVPVVSGVVAEEARAVIREVASENGCSLLEAGEGLEFEYVPPQAGTLLGSVNVQSPWTSWSDVTVPLPGRHQALNTALALAAVDTLRQQDAIRMNDTEMAEGLTAAQALPARVEVLGTNPLLVLDSAHNEASMAAVMSTLEELSAPRPRVAIFAATQQKDIHGMLGHVAGAFDDIILTEYILNPRAVPQQQLFEMADALPDVGRLHLAENPAAALEMARSLHSGQAATICTTGSFFIASEIRELIRGDN